MNTTPTWLADRIANVETLYTIADNLRGERTLWSNPLVRQDLDQAALMIEHAARAAVGESDVYAEAWAEAGTMFLRMHVAWRRFIVSCTTEPSTTPPSATYLTLDCRDGRHMACDHCACYCHRTVRHG